MASQFSQFFVSKITNIRLTLPVAQVRDLPLYTTSSLNSFHPVSVSEVTNIITKAPNKSCELDPIPTDLIKKCLSATAPAIASIINTSFATGEIPRDLKKAMIRPILKKPTLDKESFHNYRPISNLPFLSKVMERAAFSRLLEYLQENNLLDSRQSAYRPHHSVETLLTDLTDHILMQMDMGNITALVLLDMSSAFDTVEHSILTERLRSFGVGGLTLNWFNSYLSDRSQYVRVNDATSEPTPLTSGVPQGSVGGPLLFSLYLRPVSDIILTHNVHYHCYADDIQLYVSFPPSTTAFSTAIRQLELCIDDIKSWMECNGLKLNDCKSEFMVLGSKQMLSKVKSDTCKIRIGDSNISPSETVRNLGVKFDANLSFKNHITYVLQSVRFQLRNLGFIRKCLTKNAAEQLIHALISSRIDFSNALFCNLPQKEIYSLQRLQNCAARLLTYTKKSTHITPVLRSLHWLPVHKRIIFKILLLVYHTLHTSAPTYLQNSLHVYQPLRRLRSSDTSSHTLQTPRIKHSWGNRAFSYIGPKLWNDLPHALRQMSSLATFKSSLKTHLFDDP